MKPAAERRGISPTRATAGELPAVAVLAFRTIAQKPVTKERAKTGRPPKQRETIRSIQLAADARTRSQEAARQRIKDADHRFADIVRETLAITDPKTGRPKYSLADISASSGVSITHLHRLLNAGQ